MKEITRLLSALADPTRLRLLRLLHQQELCVCELMEAVQLPQYKVSRHLRELRRVGVVQATRSGRWMHYRISGAAARSPLHQDLLKLLDVHLRDFPEAKRDDTRLAKQLAGGRADRYACR
ncbi:MAG: ArsR family transcriptional regulator [candidate division NC10 bacterium]|nr:ArsR family transcriptional regulator [candidate division NC10 bacterium]